MTTKDGQNKWHPFLWLLPALLLLPLMISNDSLWLDEGDTATYALQPDFHSWWFFLNHDLAADCQMPLSMFLAWVSAWTLGLQEWQMRAFNVLFGMLALLGMYRAGKRIQLPWLPLLLAIQPYFWFYSNEARPYALEIAGGAWLFAALVEFIVLEGAGESWAWLFSGAAVFLCYTTLLAPLPITVTLIAAGIFAVMRRWAISQKSIFILLGGAIATVPAGIFYLTTLARGAKGAQIWHVDPKFFGYVLYELTGMNGLGPAVEKIREIAKSPHLSAMLAEHAAQFLLPAIGFLLLLLVFIRGFRTRQTKPRSDLSMAILLVLGMTSFVFVAAGICIQKAFWARHFAPVFPFYVALLALAINGLLESRNRLSRVFILLFVGLLLFSSLNLRFSSEYRKDDYRGASEFARQALGENKTVWWVAGSRPAEYYHLDCVSSHPETGKAFCLMSPQTVNFPPPDYVIISKPDIFDSGGQIMRLIKANDYKLAQTFTDFQVWQKPK
ncbi:MAG TPA: hypothetical protein VGI03_14670 [Verrucomicrobiae bacterium]|jgi:hypothetical protein